MRRAFIVSMLLVLPAFVSAGPAPSAPAPAAHDSAEPAARPLAEALAELAGDRLFREATVGLQVVDLDTGQEVYGWHADREMVPASTMKILTSAAALHLLGPSYRFTTSILATAAPDGDGVLDGDVYVRGGGDPTMVVETLWKMVRDLRLQGVREVTGDVYFDDGRFDRSFPIAGWHKAADARNGPAYFATIGALCLNFDTVAVVVGPGPSPGSPARAELETEAPGIVTVDDRLVTVPARGRRRVHVEREIAGRGMVLRLEGRVPQGSPALLYYRTVPDPTAYFTAAFAALARDEGIRVRGHYLEGTVPDDASEIVTLRSRPLAAILMDMNKYSNNFMAEQVLKTIGAEVSGGQGTTAAGLEYVAAYLESLGVPREEFKLVNGSGLTRETRVRPEHLTRVLADMAADPQVGSEFVASLAIGGRDGTLWSRFAGEDEVGRVRAKTGTMDGVHCLAGYARSVGGHRYAFAYLVNDIRGSIAGARRAHDRFVEVLLASGGPALAEHSD